MSLEDELQIPPDAYMPASSGFSLKVSNGTSIELSTTTSLRSSSSPRCLIVGRQATVADLRIQHGTISRKHAAFYFMRGDVIMLKEFGGKHGTRVNGQLIKGAVELHQGDVIVFGSVWESTFTLEAPVEMPREPEASSITTVHDVTKQAESQIVTQPQEDEAPTVGVTRHDREAQIAAMVASFDEKPTYQSYTPVMPQLEAPKAGKQDSAAQQHGFPIDHEFHVDSPDENTKHVLASLIVDKSGSRFAVGIGPYLKLYDFSGMDRQRTMPFKTIIVEEGYNVEHACYSNSGHQILVGTASPQPTVLDRDGENILQFIRGDQYVMDMARTSGHVHEVTGVDWHPLERDIVLTSSLDGSARLWNLNGKTQFQKLVCDKVYRAKNARGQRTAVTAVAYHPGGREFALGTACGSLQIWSSIKVRPRPERVVYNAHSEGKPVTAVVYNPGGTQIATRSSSDNAVHVWDARRLSRSSKPVATCSNVPSTHERSSCDFSPNGKYLVVGCSGFENSDSGKRQEVGTVRFFQIAGGQEGKAIDEVPSKPGVGVVQVKWHGKLNQILVGCSDGSVVVLYDETMSKNGALISLSKAGRKIDGLSELLASRVPTNAFVGEILNPLSSHARGGKRKNLDESSLHSSKQLRPELPATGIKVGGQSSASATFTQFIARTLLNNDGKGIAGRDPREDLFKYHDASESLGDKPLLAEKTAEEEEEELKSKKM